jgi:hypothetical protein
MTDLSITVTYSEDPRIDHCVGRRLSDGVSMEIGANIAHPISTVAELQPFLFVDDAVAMVGWRAASWPREHRDGSRTSDILICRIPRAYHALSIGWWLWGGAEGAAWGGWSVRRGRSGTRNRPAITRTCSGAWAPWSFQRW